MMKKAFWFITIVMAINFIGQGFAFSVSFGFEETEINEGTRGPTEINSKINLNPLEEIRELKKFKTNEELAREGIVACFIVVVLIVFAHFTLDFIRRGRGKKFKTALP